MNFNKQETRDADVISAYKNGLTDAESIYLGRKEKPDTFTNATLQKAYAFGLEYYYKPHITDKLCEQEIIHKIKY